MQARAVRAADGRTLHAYDTSAGAYHAELRLYPDEGHISVLKHTEDALCWLAARSTITSAGRDTLEVFS